MFMVAGEQAGIMTPLPVMWLPVTRRRACSITSPAVSCRATMCPRLSCRRVMLPDCVFDTAFTLARVSVRQAISSLIVVSSPAVPPRASRSAIWRSTRSAQVLAAVLVGNVRVCSLWPLRRTIARQRPFRFCSVAIVVPFRVVPRPAWHTDGTDEWESPGKIGKKWVLWCACDRS